MDNNISISIIIPVYNSEEYIDNTIKSILNQDLKGYEIILIDDCSTDKSIRIMEEYEHKYKNIRLLRQQTNSGQGAARNIGINQAKGKYIYMLDSDDEIESKALKICYEKAHTNNLDLLLFGMSIRIKDEVKNGYGNFGKSNDEIMINSGVSEDNVMSGIQYYSMSNGSEHISSMIINRQFILENSLFFEENELSWYNQDFDFIIRVFLKANRVMGIEQPFFLYSVRKNSVTTQNRTLKQLYADELSIINGFNILCKEKQLDKGYVEKVKKLFNSQVYAWIYDINTVYSCFENDKINKLRNAISTYYFYYIKVFKGFNNNDFIFIGKALQFIVSNINCSYTEFIIKFEGEIKEWLEKIEDKCKIIKCSLLDTIGFENPHRIVGIYGFGSHTQNMIDFYVENMNKIKSKLIFIDSNIASNTKEYMVSKIINVKDIDKYDFDCIVISSKSFEGEMKKNIVRYSNKSVRIVSFYKEYSEVLF